MKLSSFFNGLLASFILMATAPVASTQTLDYINYLSDLDLSAEVIQFQNVATGEYIVLRPDPRGGGALEANANPDPIGWYFYQGQGAETYNIEVKRKGIDGFNWSNYDNADDNKAFIAWNHAKRAPNATTPVPPHDFYLEEAGKAEFRIKWRHNGEYLELMPNLRLYIKDSKGAKIISRPLNTSNQHQLWRIKTSASVFTCMGKQFKVDAAKKIYEKINGQWSHVGDRCNGLECSRRRLFCRSTDGSLWRYNEQPHNWTSANTLLAGQFLNGGDGTMGDAMHLQSANGKHFFYMQENGDLGLWTHDPSPRIVWNSKTHMKGANYTLHMQPDGNLVAYDANNQPIWASQTQHAWDARYKDKKYMPVKAVLEDDGKLVLYSATGFRAWDSAHGKYSLN